MVLIRVYKSKNEDICQIWSLENGHPIFNKTVSRQRFQYVLRVLRFDDAEYRRQYRSDDKLEPIRECFDLWVNTLRDGNVPGSMLTVDEELVTFRGRCPFKQYIPSKPGRYGIKFWILSDSKLSYVYNMETYIGKKPIAGREVNLGERVVLGLLEGIDAAGRSVTCDNFFTSLSLARKLLAKNITLVGTIRKNEPDPPPGEMVSTKERKQFTTIFWFQQDCMIVSYCPKGNKIVNLLSTLHS